MITEYSISIIELILLLLTLLSMILVIEMGLLKLVVIKNDIMLEEFENYKDISKLCFKEKLFLAGIYYKIKK